MRIDFYGVAFETPSVTIHLWSPWRAAELEHRLFQAVRDLPRVQAEKASDEWRLELRDPKSWKGPASRRTRAQRLAGGSGPWQ